MDKLSDEEIKARSLCLEIASKYSGDAITLTALTKELLSLLGFS